MDANELKKYILDNNKISLVLEKVGCHNIKEYQSEYRAALPNKTNNTAVCVKKDSLFTAIRSSDVNIQGDIFTLIIELKHISFGKANKLMHNYLGLKYQFSNKNEIISNSKSDILDIFKKAKRSRCVVNQVYDIYDESILKEYSNLPHISWIKEGIMPFACERFNIGYDYSKKRIIIPWRYWCGENEKQYVGITGRTTIPNWELFDIPKYLAIKPFSKRLNLYGLYENYQTIQQERYVVVYEAEKSVLKRYSRKDGTGTAIGSHNLSDEQAKILIGLNVDIVIAYDKGIDLFDIWKDCEKFYKIRNVYYIYDKWGILQNKESPADKPNKQFQFLLKCKVKYDEQQHSQFTKRSKVKSIISV